MKPYITFTLSLDGRELEISKTSVYRLISYDGIESADVSLTVADAAVTDGAYIQAARVGARTITISFAVDNRSRTEELRLSLISFMQPKKKGTLTVSRGGVTRCIDFYLASRVDFEQQNIVDDRLVVTLALACPQPYFYDIYDTVYGMTQTARLLTFPFNSAAGIGVTSGIKRRAASVTIHNGGDLPCGVVAEIVSKAGAVTNPYVSCGGRTVKIIDVTDINDVYTVDTREGHKGITLNGARTYNIDRTSIFFALPVGDSVVTVSADAGDGSISSTVAVRLRYLGV